MEVDYKEAAAAEGLRQLELSALPTGNDWQYWWRERSRFVEMTYGWERALVDAITRMVKNNLTLARQVRLEGAAKRVVKYDSDGHVYGEESRTPAEITKEALVWFITQIKPAQKDAPVWAEILFKGCEGAFIQQARLGLELTAIKRKGYLSVNHSATMPLPSEKEVRDKGMAAFGKFNDRGGETL